MPKALHAIPLSLALLVAACPAPPQAVEPASTSAPLRRTVTPKPTLAPSLGPGRSAAIATIKAVQPWVRRDGDGAIFTFLFFTKPGGDLVFFTSKPPLKVSYAFAPGEAATPLASGSVEMAEDALKFSLEAGAEVSAGDRLYCSYTVHLPDNRRLEGGAWVTVEGAGAP